MMRNIAFGISDQDIDVDRVWKVIQEAQLDSFVRSLPQQLESFVGERGVRLSGGQKQRLGIARALYHDPSVIVLDEPTSALDHKTEEGIFETVQKLKNKTFIIVSHRPAIIKYCDKVFDVVAGSVVHLKEAHNTALGHAHEIGDGQPSELVDKELGLGDTSE
jgi:ABC-type bacteriocin/lantibiotic exporter with double-glycine peptidase domain